MAATDANLVVKSAIPSSSSSVGSTHHFTHTPPQQNNQTVVKPPTKSQHFLLLSRFDGCKCRLRAQDLENQNLVTPSTQTAVVLIVHNRYVGQCWLVSQCVCVYQPSQYVCVSSASPSPTLLFEVLSGRNILHHHLLVLPPPCLASSRF